jgi:hypothetical protein
MEICTSSTYNSIYYGNVCQSLKQQTVLESELFCGTIWSEDKQFSRLSLR